MAQTIDLVAEHPHYREHLLPIWELLQEEGIAGKDWGNKCPDPSRILLVASSQELRRARHPHNKCFLVEHGAGQTYIGDRSSAYSDGTKGYDNVVGFICSTDAVYQRRRLLFPDVPSTLAGVPKLDKYVNQDVSPTEKTACLTFHWDCPVAVESHCTFPNFVKYLPRAVAEWKAQGWTIYGHYHPRIPELSHEYKKLGIPVLHTEQEVFNTCSVLIADNTSLLFEFMGLGRSVVFLNGHLYRREINHGLRFWEAVEHGTDLRYPRDILSLNLNALPQPDGWSPYGDLIDGYGAKRAVDFIAQSSILL